MRHLAYGPLAVAAALLACSLTACSIETGSGGDTQTGIQLPSPEGEWSASDGATVSICLNEQSNWNVDLELPSGTPGATSGSSASATFVMSQDQTRAYGSIDDSGQQVGVTASVSGTTLTMKIGHLTLTFPGPPGTCP